MGVLILAEEEKSVVREIKSWKYNELRKYLPEVTKWISEGATFKDIAQRFNVNTDTIYRWRKRHEEFNEAVNKGLDLLFDDIEASLYQSCKTQTINEEWYDENGNLSKKFVKQIPANQRSIEYALNNRRPEKWRADTKNIDLSISEVMRDKFKDMNITDIVALANLDLDSVEGDTKE